MRHDDQMRKIYAKRLWFVRKTPGWLPLQKFDSRSPVSAALRIILTRMQSRQYEECCGGTCGNAAAHSTDSNGAGRDQSRSCGGGMRTASEGQCSTSSTCSQELIVPNSAPSHASKRPPPRRIVGQAIPDSILKNQALLDAIAILPTNYNFEILKTVHRLRSADVRRVALQFPEGLLMYACTIADIFESFAGVEHCLIMGDVTYGACCVDDYSAEALDCEFLVHYGHSCLVPVNETNVACMYVFVDIQMDVEHFVDTCALNFLDSAEFRDRRMILAGTIQFASSLHVAKGLLEKRGFGEVLVPQSRPLSRGEMLGCTAPRVEIGAGVGVGVGVDGTCSTATRNAAEQQYIVFLADGRFHLEALMIANPETPAYRYDPYGRKLTLETYDQVGMRVQRRAAIEKAKGAKHWGLVLGTLGRQGNPKILERIKGLVKEKGCVYTLVLLSEVSPEKLGMLSKRIDAFVQIACPRLSIDWGDGFERPTLNPYEAFVALGEVPGFWEADGEDYPMDFYSSGGGAWNASWHKGKERKSRQGVGVV